MTFVCCGIKYAKTDPSTYDCIETDLIKPQTVSEETIFNVWEYVRTNLIAADKKQYEFYTPPEFIVKKVDGETVIKELAESLTCKKNGCRRVKITRYNSKNKKIGQPLEFKGYEADFYLLAIMQNKIAKRLPQKTPIRTIPSAKKIPFIHGEAIGPTKSRKRFNMHRKCWADKFKKGIIVDKWVPDILESELKTSIDKSLIRDEKIVV